MSEILIRGMEMPEHCGECKLKAEYDNETFCPFFADNVEYWIAAGRRHEDCPLGYIPPHGRLIDAGELRELYEEWENDKEAGIDIDKCHVPIPVIRQNIDDAPTVIPASE